MGNELRRRAAWGNNRRIVLALLLLMSFAIASSAEADPVVYFYSGDLVYQYGPDPIGLKGAHFSMMTVIEDASVPSVGGSLAQYYQGKSFLTLSNAANSTINGTYAAVSENLIVRAQSDYYGQLQLNSSFQIGGSTWYGGAAGGLAVANFPIGFFGSTFPALPTFNNFDVTGPNSVLYGTNPNYTVFSIDHFEASGQRITGLPASLSTTFWDLLTQVSGTGPRGPAGPQGAPGAVGPQGATGPQGPTGLQGASGPQGPQGIQGAPGPIGLPGMAWMGPWSAEVTYVATNVVSVGGSSYIALQTSTGSQPPGSDWSLVSAQGDSGSQGLPGRDGLTGPQGPQGVPGETGPIGPTGPQGPEGSAGVQGPAGAVGPQGAQGPIGPAGASGPMGPAGVQGPAGVPGPVGPQGPIGPAGSQVWNVFLPGSLTRRLKGATFTPDTPITVTRVQLQLQTAPLGCATNAVLSLSDGTPAGTRTLNLNSGSRDTGSVALDYASGVPLTLSTSVAASGCAVAPADGNIVIQYKAR
jgi:hypothetical protein